MSRPFKQVDVFTDTLGLGNPVAVVLDAEGLADETLFEFARWTNLSETTFVLPPTHVDADYRVRILTPTAEFPFAGHPTLGTCHAWLEAGGVPKQPGMIVQECGVGLVPIRQDGQRLAFATPPLMRSGAPTNAERESAIAALGIEPSQVLDAAWIDNGPGWLGVLVDSVATIDALQPTLNPGAILGVVAVTGGDPAVKVRAFFDAGGTREDPVTGSLNGSIAQWLLGNGMLSAPYRSSQGTSMQRDGKIFIDEQDGEIWVGGHAVTGIDGSVHL